MANLTETADNYTPSIYRLEIDDQVAGGPDGLSNRQAKQLGDRTRYLKDHVDAIETTNTTQDQSLTALSGRIDTVEAGASDPVIPAQDYWWRG